jgi:hypothetical protein
VEIEWLILADAAQVVGNKLYLMGGGWENIVVNSPFPVDQRMGIALSISVPWNETNKKHIFEVEITSEDQETEQIKSLLKMGGQFEVGRAPGIRQGQDQRVQMAVDLTLHIEAPGVKTVIARIEGQEMRRLEFTVIKGQMGIPKQ